VKGMMPWSATLHDQPLCCRPPHTGTMGHALGNWFFPNTSRVPSSGQQWDFHRTRGQMVVTLHRRGGDDGIYWKYTRLRIYNLACIQLLVLYIVSILVHASQYILRTSSVLANYSSIILIYSYCTSKQKPTRILSQDMYPDCSVFRVLLVMQLIGLFHFIRVHPVRSQAGAF